MALTVAKSASFTDDFAFAAQPNSLSNPETLSSFNQSSASKFAVPLEVLSVGSNGFRIPSPISVTRSNDGFPRIATIAPGTASSPNKSAPEPS